MDLLRRSLELGLGALMLTKEAAEDVLDELTDEEDRAKTKQALDELLERGQKWRRELAEQLAGEVKKAVSQAGLVTREEHQQLQARVAELERALAEGQGPCAEAANDL